MSPQNPSDQAQPRRWNENQEQRRWNDPRADQAQTRPVSGQGYPPAAVPPPADPPRSRPSRRALLGGGAAVVVAAAVGAGAVYELDKKSAPATLMPVSKPVAMAPMAPSAMAGPLVVYIPDTTTGLFQVFGGTGQTQVNNPDLVSQLLDNLKLA